MHSTFDTVAKIIALICDVPPERITPESNLLSDLGIDSLDLLDVAFAIDDAFGVAVPIDHWLQAVHMRRDSSHQYFVMKALCGNIDALTIAGNA
jgi:acyl carrier protein